ncbi:MAG: isoprenylcysteine carboxylmethyltransferase family protein [Candidatus Hydrothermarchaeales archaeon]
MKRRLAIQNMVTVIFATGLVLVILSSMASLLKPGLLEELEELTPSQDYAYGHWGMSIFSILLFSYFVLSFFMPVKKREWRSLGLYEAYLVALFTEMYGFPLTIYLISSVSGTKLSYGHEAGHLFAVFLTKLGILDLGVAWFLVMVASSIVILAGLLLMDKGWRKVYYSGGSLVTEGVYSYVRHPQYLGLITIIFGFLIQWPTIITIAMVPLLIAAYYYLAKKEEEEMEERFGYAYRVYKDKVPMFIPSRRPIFNPMESRGY